MRWSGPSWKIDDQKPRLKFTAEECSVQSIQSARAHGQPKHSCVFSLTFAPGSKASKATQLNLLDVPSDIKNNLLRRYAPASQKQQLVNAVTLQSISAVKNFELTGIFIIQFHGDEWLLLLFLSVESIWILGYSLPLRSTYYWYSVHSCTEYFYPRFTGFIVFPRSLFWYGLWWVIDT